MQPIRAKRVTALTGTPFPNKIVEAQPLLARLAPEEFGNFFQFARRYCDAKRGRYGWSFDGSSNLPELQDRLRRTVMVRRLKNDVLTELPPKVRQIILLPAEDCGVEVAAERELFATHERKIAELQVARELARLAGDKKAYARVARELKKCAAIAFDKMAEVRRKTAVAKLPAALAHIKETLESTSKTLVFAHHKAVLAGLYKGLAAYNPMKIEGGDSLANRQAAVERFQNDPTCRVAVLSILAAGVGLTLTAASLVQFVEEDWVPANVTQAEDRAYRISQRDTVLVQHLVVDGSIDVRMIEATIQKQEIADRALDLPPDEDDLPANATEDQVAAAEEALLNRRAAAEEALVAAKAAAVANVDREARRAAEVEVAKAQAELTKLEAKLAKRETALEQRPSTKRLTKATLAKQAEKITPEQIAAVHAGLRALAGDDLDRAMKKNDVGFNKADGMLGHMLANLDALDARQAVIGRTVCKTYRNQLGDAALKAMGA